MLSHTTTTLPPPLPVSSSGGDDPMLAAVASATRMAARLLVEISLRWPTQARGWSEDVAMTASWARVLGAAKVTEGELAAALSEVSSRPFPPSLGAILCAVEEIRERHRRDMTRRPPPALGEALSAEQISKNRQKIKEIRERFFPARTRGGA